MVLGWDKRDRNRCASASNKLIIVTDEPIVAQIFSVREAAATAETVAYYGALRSDQHRGACCSHNTLASISVQQQKTVR